MKPRLNNPIKKAVIALGESIRGLGGCAQVALQQMDLLRESGIQVETVCPDNFPRQPQVPKLSALNFPLLSWLISNRARQMTCPNTFLLSHGLCGVRGGRGPHLHLYHSTVAGMAEAFRPGMSHAEHFILRRIGGGMEWLTARRADVCVVVSENVAEQVDRFYKRPKVELIPNGIPRRLFSPLPELELREPFIGLVVGRMDYGKGLKALQALGGAISDNHQIRLAGTVRQPRGWNSSQLHVLGLVPRSHMREIYQNCHYVLSLSRYEGCQLNLLEAWACGRPVITTNVGVVRDLMGRCPAFDELVISDLDDVGQVARCAERLRNDPELGRAQVTWGQSLLESQFSEERCLNSYRELLEKLVACP